MRNANRTKYISAVLNNLPFFPRTQSRSQTVQVMCVLAFWKFELIEKKKFPFLGFVPLHSLHSQSAGSRNPGEQRMARPSFGIPSGTPLTSRDLFRDNASCVSPQSLAATNLWVTNSWDPYPTKKKKNIFAGEKKNVPANWICHNN